MTLQQLAFAARTDTIWLQNARRLLKRRIFRTPNAARWWGFVRMLTVELGLPLKQSADAADAILGGELAMNRVRIAASKDGACALQVDLQRFLSTSNAALASAFVFAAPKTRGRRPRKRPTPGRPDPLNTVWRIPVADEPAALERLAAHLVQWEAYPRGLEAGRPFICDAATLRAVPRLALTSTKGDIDVLVGALP
jgi:hypothetical protein